MTSPTKNFRKQIGPAVWLLELLIGMVPQDWAGNCHVFVAGGRLISDRQLGIWLGESPRTVTAWRRRLRNAGALDWTVKPGVGRIFVVAPMADKKVFAVDDAQTDSRINQEALPQCRRLETQALGSRFLQ